MAHEEFRPKDFNGSLSHLMEECAEVISAAAKTQRFGLDSVNPYLPIEQQITNQQWLEDEILDVEKAIRKLRNLLYPDMFDLDLQRSIAMVRNHGWDLVPAISAGYISASGIVAESVTSGG